MIDDHHRRARMCGEHVQLCAGHGGTVRWSTALDPALEVADSRPGAGGAGARWSQNERVESQCFSLCLRYQELRRPANVLRSSSNQ